MVYMYAHSPNRTLDGFLEHSLAYFNTSESSYVMHTTPVNLTKYKDITECRYVLYSLLRFVSVQLCFHPLPLIIILAKSIRL